MAKPPKPQPGSPPIDASTSNHRNLKSMNISELVSVLRPAVTVFDQVEEVLVSRDAKHQADIASLLEKIETERRTRIQAEEELKKREEDCERRKRLQENYEALLKQVKNGDLVDKKTVGELRNKNIPLEFENSKLKELKQKWVHDSNAVAELKNRIRKLEDEKQDDKAILAAVKIRNGELEEEVKKNTVTIDGLTIENNKLLVEKLDDKNRNSVLEDEMKKNKESIDELRSENSKLVDEKHRLEGLIEHMERKFEELNECVKKLEDDTRLLSSTEVEPLADPVVIIGIKDEEDVRDYEFGNDTGGPTPLQRNEDGLSLSKGNKDASFGAPGSARGKSKFENVQVINLDDDDDDESMSQGLHGKKATPQSVVQQKNISAKAQTIEMLKRKLDFSAIDTSSSNSSSSSDDDNISISIFRSSCKKKIKT